MAISNNEQQERRENLKARIRFATKTVSQWMVEDEIILKGEPTIAIPDGYTPGTSNIRDFRPIFKIGDGKHVWADLPEVGNSSLVFEKTDVNVSDSDFLNTELPNAVPGTFVIVTSTLVEDNPDTEENEEKTSQTAYVSKTIQDEEGNEVTVWVALDGNYSADTVYFEDDFMLAGDYDKVGNYKVNTTLSAKGKSLTDVMSSILTKELEGKITNPSCSITLNEADDYEVGTVITPTFTTTFNKGSYSYGPSDTGVTATSYKATFNDEVVAGESGQFKDYMVVDGTNINAVLVVDYSDGVLAKTNLGNDGTNKILAGSCSKDSSSIRGYRNIFYGVRTTDDTLDSNVVRSLGGVVRSDITTTISIDSVGEDPNNIVVCCPTNKSITKVEMPSSLYADVTSFFERIDSVSVTGANGNEPMDYVVYKYKPASIATNSTFIIYFN